MVDWMNPAQIAADGARFSSLMHVLLGLYIWEWVLNLPFELLYLTRKKPFKWPLIFYFANRYVLLFAMVGIAIALNVTEEINCQALYTFNQLFGNAAIGLASINLSIRTMAIWTYKNYWVIGGLSVAILVHWVLLLHGVLIEAAWVPGGVGCVITGTNHKLLAATFCYTMCFDAVVLVLTSWRLVYSVAGPGNRDSPVRAVLTGNSLASFIFKDGLIFFLIAFLANMVATVFLFLGLNPVMSIISNVPAALASSIVACRVVRRLASHSEESSGTSGHPTGQTSTLAFRTNDTQHSQLATKGKPDNVHVAMNTFGVPSSSDRSLVDFEGDDKDTASPASFDVNGKRGNTFDPEAQIISDEFKRPPY